MSQPQAPQPRPNGQPPSNPPPLREVSWHLFISLGLLLAGLWLWQGYAAKSAFPTVDYSDFYGWVQAGDVDAVRIRGQTIEGKLSKAKQVQGHKSDHFVTTMPEGDQSLVPLLRKEKVRISVSVAKPSAATELLLGLLPWVLIIGAWVWLSRRMQRTLAGGAGPFGILKSKSKRFDKETSVPVNFDDVAGLHAAKRDLQEVVQFLKEPERFQRLGGKVPRGVLLVGPPGTGKTLLARAVAGESGVPFFSMSASEFIEMFVGVGAARVRELFQDAKKNAPAIIFIDEIDAVGRSRGAGFGGGHDEREQTLNQLLSEMDGFERSDLTIVLAATNRPDVLDPALLRPGRFDRRVIVERPELNARRAILVVHTKGKPLAEDLDLQAVAENTPGFSGADLANLVNEAALGATRRGADVISNEDFGAAFDKIVLGDPSEAKLAPQEKRRVALHEAGHAITAYFSEDSEPLHRVSILPRGMALGVTQQTPAADRHVKTQPELETRLRVLMGGYAAEKLVLGNVSTGAENDLKEATRLASSMVAHYGMSNALGPAYYEHQEDHPFLGQRIASDSGASDATVYVIETEARRLLGAALTEATRLLTEHKTRLTRLQQTLCDKETLEKHELLQVLQQDSGVLPQAERNPASAPAAEKSSRAS